MLSEALNKRKSNHFNDKLPAEAKEDQKEKLDNLKYKFEIFSTIDSFEFTTKRKTERFLVLKYPKRKQFDFISKYWKYATKFEKCKYCHQNVSFGFMDDHLSNICSYSPMQCPLCNMRLLNGKNIIVGHWVCMI